MFTLIMAQKKRKEDREPIQVGVGVKRKVERFLVGKKKSLGEFYNEAAEEKLKREKQ
jgi:hypothetical protein